MIQHPPFPLEGYRLRVGTRRDRAKLVQFMALAYDEQGHHCSPQALTETVNTHYANNAPLWWVVPQAESTEIACLWLGNVLDPHQGDRYGCILLLYVAPAHRRRGIATALLRHAQDWAIARGDQQLGLQVFADNAAAQALYQKLGYVTTALWMTQPLQ
ncbi:MAG: GNAT family N-acetyltransferase [Leptolyngbyaceae cyanobacterium]